MARPKVEASKNLTDSEAQIMNALWELNQGKAQEVQELVNEKSNRDFAYTTVSTMLRVLEKKEVVKSVKEGRSHIYIPLLTKEGYQKKATSHLVDQVYEGRPSLLIKNLLGQSKITKKELQEVQDLLKGVSDDQ